MQSTHHMSAFQLRRFWLFFEHISVDARGEEVVWGADWALALEAMRLTDGMAF
jgi:hypothetical protein